jgi:hypothetical protein
MRWSRLFGAARIVVEINNNCRPPVGHGDVEMGARDCGLEHEEGKQQADK